MASYKTPGVYVEEISTLPPSVAQVSTAIPAFVGYTERGPAVARIDSLLEYEALFGGASPTAFVVTTAEDPSTGLARVHDVAVADREAEHPRYLLHYCVRHYFANGGGSCFVVSVGNYDAAPAKAAFEAGLARLEEEDEPTLILLTDAVKLAAADYHDLCQQALASCKKLGDRFAILDVPGGDVEGLRNGIGTHALSYGAAYYPYLVTTLAYHYRDEQVQIQAGSGESAESSFSRTFGDAGIEVRFTGPPDPPPRARVIDGDPAEALTFEVEQDLLTVRNVDGRTGAQAAAAWTAWTATNDPGGYDVSAVGDGSGAVPHTSNRNEPLQPVGAGDDAINLNAVALSDTGLFNQVKAAMARQRVVLPPSAAIAGIYARVDRERGVWKAPANVSVSAVIGPVTKTTHEAQEGLNVDPTAGKSINVIRAFTGKGTLVWGSRTLAGNDNEWRYVSVRRLFILIEESIQKASAFAVFEPNDAATWMKVKGMIESYLHGLWERGALAGPTPESAYVVNVGLGKTMTGQDILEGRMIVEVGVAAVRPAEFIILRFSHKMQEA